MESKKSISIRKAIKFGFSPFTHHFSLFLKVIAITVGISFVHYGGIKLIKYMSNMPSTLPAIRIGIASGRLILPALLLALLAFCAFIVSMVIGFGWIRIGLDLQDKNKSSVRRLFLPIHILARAFGGIILFYLSLVVYGILVGSALLILALITKGSSLAFFLILILCLVALIPFTMLGLRYSFVVFAIIDTECGPVQGLRKSAYITKGRILALLGTTFVLLGMGVVIFLPALVLGNVLGKLSVFLGFAISILTQATILYILTFSLIDIYRQLQMSKKEASSHIS